ncbi:MAG: Zn-dependent hydrolase [Ilumatobacteraceae bacterium]
MRSAEFVPPHGTRVDINDRRLMKRIMALGEVGGLPGGGCNRLALTDADRDGRNLVVAWMRDLNMNVAIDVVGNIVGTWQVGTGAPVMTGSHIDTVRTGGLYDGNYGVLAGLEVIETCQERGIEPRRPLAVGIFTDEEGARYAPDMLGSLVYVGGMLPETAHDVIGIDGTRLGDELERIGYLGATPCPGVVPHAFVELHIEQGPLLEVNQVRIGAVTGVQGISWQEVTIEGQSNHAGTTPMHLRKDPAFAAAKLTVFLRDLATRLAGNQVCTVGKIDVHPNLTNVVPSKVVMTLDVRNTDESILQSAEADIARFCEELAVAERVRIVRRPLARFEPVIFDDRVVDLVESVARDRGNSVQRMPSGAGHDAQMLARLCPTGMIFVPSHGGLSHNVNEHTDEADLVSGANILLDVMLRLAGTNF